jgi:hypothetical protein
MSSSQFIKYMIDANAPMIFTYSYSRPEVKRIAYPVDVKGNIVSTIDAETGKYKKFKVEGITLIPSIEDQIYRAIEEDLTISFYYRNLEPLSLRSGVPIRFLNDGKTVLVRIEHYLPYRRYSNQVPSFVEFKSFTISKMQELVLLYPSTLPKKVNFNITPLEESQSEFYNEEEEETEEEPLEVDLIDLNDEECIGCKHNIENQIAHYGGCIRYEGDDFLN